MATAPKQVRTPHGAKAAEVYGIVGYLLSLMIFGPDSPRSCSCRSSIARHLLLRAAFLLIWFWNGSFVDSVGVHAEVGDAGAEHHILPGPLLGCCVAHVWHVPLWLHCRDLQRLEPMQYKPISVLLHNSRCSS